MADVSLKLQGAHDKAAQKESAVGLREFRVFIQPPRPAGTPEAEDAALFGTPEADPVPAPPELELTPRPLVAQVSQRLVTFSAGRVESGDVKLSSVSRRPEVLAHLTNPATRYRIEGPAHEGVYQALDGFLTVDLDQASLVIRRIP